MKFNQYTWNLYKQSPDGQKAIKEFEEANEKMTEYDLFTKYNPYSAQFFSEDYFLDTCGLFWSVIFEEAKELGISKRTLENAKKELNIHAKKINNSWYWELDNVKPKLAE